MIVQKLSDGTYRVKQRDLSQEQIVAQNLFYAIGPLKRMESILKKENKGKDIISKMANFRAKISRLVSLIEKGKNTMIAPEIKNIMSIINNIKNEPSLKEEAGDALKFFRRILKGVPSS